MLSRLLEGYKSVSISSLQMAWRSPTPGKLLKLPISPFTSNATQTPFTSHRLLSKNENCLKLKLLQVSVGFGSYEKKMEERWGWDVLMKTVWVITSWKMCQCTRSLLRSQRGQEGVCAHTSHTLTRKPQGRCHLTSGDSPLPRALKGPPSSILL